MSNSKPWYAAAAERDVVEWLRTQELPSDDAWCGYVNALAGGIAAGAHRKPSKPEGES